MLLFTKLIHGVGEARRSIRTGGTNEAIKNVGSWQCAAVTRSWRGWAEARCAFEHNNMSDCIQWLIAAEKMTASEPDSVRTAEINLLWAELWMRAEEPQRAIAYAQVAWKCWFALDQNRSSVKSSGELRVMLAALTYPDVLTIEDKTVFRAWIRQRCAPNLRNSIRQIFEACRTLKISEPALELVAEIRKSLSERSGQSSGRSWKGTRPPEESAPFVASLLQQAAYLHDDLGYPQLAIEALNEAFALLLPLHPILRQAQLSQIEFDLANQCAKAGDYVNAISEFQRLANVFSSIDEEEQAWRARYSILLCRWKMREEQHTLNDDLEALLIRYEELLAQSTSWEQRSHIRQNLSVANDLWISVHAATLDSDISKERFLNQIFSNREGGTDAHSLRKIAASATETLTAMSVLTSRLAEENGKILVLSIESGVDELFAVTLRPGDIPLRERLTIERLEPACIEAIEASVLTRRAITESIASGEVSMTGMASADFVVTCRSLWDTLPHRTRELISDASTIYFAPDTRGDLDEMPLELAHTGEAYLGLQKVIVRASSWRQLTDSFAHNRTDNLGFGRVALVRGSDVPGLSDLRTAEAEIAAVEARATKVFEHVDKLTCPSVPDFLDALDKGLDILHFTGHSFANEAQENLILRDGSYVGVPELEAPRSTPAPLSIFCSCLIGLHRRTRHGSGRGIATSLLDGGAPAVVAAMVPLPDAVGQEFAVALHFHAKDRSIGEAMRMTRLSLARRFHPTCWASFALFGSPKAQISPKPETRTTPWYALLIRCIATQGKEWQTELEAALSNAENLNQSVREYAWALARQSAEDNPAPILIAVPRDLTRSLSVEARVLLHAAELLVEAALPGSRDSSSEALRKLLLLQDMTQDNYLLIAIALAGMRSGFLLIQTDSTASFLSRATHKLGWLNRSHSGLKNCQAEMEQVRERWAEQITVLVSEMSGVDINDVARAIS